MEGGTSINTISVIPLLALGETLGISPDIWENGEELEYISYYNPGFSREKAKELSTELITSLKEEYGDALTCIFRLGDLPVLDIHQVTDDKDLEEFRKSTEGSPTLIFDFTLDKSRLILNKFGNVPEFNLFLYFFSNTLQRFLTGSLSQLESLLWGLELNTIHKVVLFVVDHEIWLNGLYLAVLGGKKIERWREVIIKPQQEDREQVRNIYDICQKNLYWQAPWLEHLTPLHLKMDEQTPYEDPISKALLIHQVNLIILYTASRTTGNINYPSLSIYAGTNQSVKLTLNNPADSVEEIFTGANHLMEMFEWTYDPKWSDDRLRLVQIIVTQYLHAASPLTRYQLFLYNAKTILGELKWHWQAFIEGKVDNYISQVQALEDYVANTVQRFADQTTSMIKSLSDTMLAAVGVSIGSFIATLFHDEINQNIFTFGMLVYAFYVLIFPLYFNMMHQWEQYEMLSNNFKEHQRRFAERLYPDKVGEIVGVQIEQSQKKFESWFSATIAAYILIILLAIVAAMWAPEFVQSTTFSIQNTTLPTV